jgi:hypothetical protein
MEPQESLVYQGKKAFEREQMQRKIQQAKPQ